MARRTGHLFRDIWTNFVNSIRPRQIKGNLMGHDNYGNKYYEIPADPSRGKRKASRWFEAPEEDFMNERSAEWESWLRHRRVEPPTQEELAKNLRISEMKRINAAELDKKFGKTDNLLQAGSKSGDEFPKYEEYDYGPRLKK